MDTALYANLPVCSLNGYCIVCKPSRELRNTPKQNFNVVIMFALCSTRVSFSPFVENRWLASESKPDLAQISSESKLDMADHYIMCISAQVCRCLHDWFNHTLCHKSALRIPLLLTNHLIFFDVFPWRISTEILKDDMWSWIVRKLKILIIKKYLYI